jgi:chromosome segregation protein
VENLLGRTVIAERLDDAIAISRRYRGAFRIVTLDGQVMNAGGSMTGGSVSKNAGVLSRANEIERLTKTVQVLQEKRRTLSAELTEANRQRDLADYELETARAGLREQEDAVLKQNRCQLEQKGYDELNIKDVMRTIATTGYSAV